VKLVTVSPTKTYVQQHTPAEMDKLVKELTYTNTSAKAEVRRLTKSDWLKRNKYEEWSAQLEKAQKKVKNTLVWADEGGTYIRPGNIPTLDMVFDHECLVKVPQTRKMAWYKVPEFDPYGYQDETVELMMAEMLKGLPCHAELATGLGKSYILQLITRSFGVETLIVTPSASIFNELLDGFTELFGKTKVGGLGDGKKKTDTLITIAIAKSLTTLKPGTKEYENIRKKKLVLGDESHTLPAETLEKAFHGVLADVPLRGFVSGTQTRGDGAIKLLESIIGKKVIERNVAWGIQNGYLTGFDFTMVNVPTTAPHFYSPDPIKMKRKHFLYNDYILDFTAKTAGAVARSMKQSSLILVDEIEQISMLARRFINQGVDFTYVHGNTVDKKELLEYGLENRDMRDEIERFNKGEVKIFIGTKCVSTGTNFFPTHFVFNLQGGSSEIGTKQGVMGRATRLLAKSRYKDCHAPKIVSKIFDFNVNVDQLAGAFFKRVEFYKEAQCPIRWIDYK